MEELPKYWVSKDGKAPGPNGYPLSIWGWSRESMADAEQVARDRLRMTIDRLREGRKPRPDEYYPRMALREEVLHHVHDGDGALIAEVSRNRYGAEILNTDAVLIADVDFPQTPDTAPGQTRLFARLFGRKQRPTADYEGQALAKIGEFAGRNASYGTHVYRTFGGLRVIVTGSGALPDSDFAADLMAQMNTDTIYVQLCATHRTYRARLTPKPWRLKQPALRTVWPHRSEAEAQWTANWVTTYNRKSEGYAVCRRVGSFGSEPSARERRVIDLHDQRSLPDEELPLA